MTPVAETRSIRPLWGSLRLAPIAALGVLFGLVCSLSASASFPGANGKIAFDSRGGALPPGIYTMNRDGSEITQLTSDGEFPQWSPDGSSIVFVRWIGGIGSFGARRQIFVMDGDGSNVRQVADTPYDDSDPAWSPDGTRIAFARQLPTGGANGLWLMRSDGSDQVALHACCTAPAWSPTGSAIAFQGQSSGTNIFVVHLGSTPVELTSDPRGNYNPEWSPDAGKIAFVSARDPVAGNELYVMNPDGEVETNVSNTPLLHEVSVSWAPNGRLLAVVAIECSPEFPTSCTVDGPSGGVYVMRPDGSHRVQLTGRTNTFHVSWQPVPG
jgi:TolB protein